MTDAESNQSRKVQECSANTAGSAHSSLFMGDFMGENCSKNCSTMMDRIIRPFFNANRKKLPNMIQWAERTERKQISVSRMKGTR